MSDSPLTDEQIHINRAANTVIHAVQRTGGIIIGLLMLIVDIAVAVLGDTSGAHAMAVSFIIFGAGYAIAIAFFAPDPRLPVERPKDDESDPTG